MNAVYAMNHMYMGRIYTHSLLSQRDLRNVIRNTDIGLFPNRCEGGTNLSLMEYMATGKPVVATTTSGHRDILTDTNCLPVKDLHPTEFKVGRR
jgi:glycosyltransferase involved in cell wall biosynthesis